MWLLNEKQDVLTLQKGEEYEKSGIEIFAETCGTYPTIGKASTEIINLQSILNLPKGTEHFMSDLPW